ncbi:MAG: hypothetical protein RL108_993 [Bacteroidota bacterium]|jgi:hypothetical protein
MKVEGINTFVKTLFGYALIILLFGLVKIELIIEIIPLSMKGVARITSYLSILISILSNLVLIGIDCTLIWYCLQLHKIYIDLSEWFQCIRPLVVSLIGSELVKFLAVFLFLKDDVKNSSFDILNSFENTSFYKISQLSDLIFFLLGLIIFYMETKKLRLDSMRINILSTIYLFISISLIYIIFNY